LINNDSNELLQVIFISILMNIIQYYWRRRTLLARPLLKEAGIASILLENPFYILLNMLVICNYTPVCMY